MKVELIAESEAPERDVFRVTLERAQLEQLHLLLLRREGMQELSRAITKAMTTRRN